MAPHALVSPGSVLAGQAGHVDRALAVDPQPPKTVIQPSIVNRPPLKTISPPLIIEEHPIDEYPRLKVVVVGAGIAGVNAGILLPRKVPDIDLVILERHADLVGPDLPSLKIQS